MSDPILYLAIDEAGTDRFGQALSGALPRGAVLAINGTLGAGKTRLVQSIATAAGVDPREVISPTFVLLHEYSIPNSALKIYHFDAYRLKDEDEFLQLGPEEYFDSDGWTLIEWGDRVAGCLPREHLRIDIGIVGPTSRQFALQSIGGRFDNVLIEIKTALGL